MQALFSNWNCLSGGPQSETIHSAYIFEHQVYKKVSNKWSYFSSLPMNRTETVGGGGGLYPRTVPTKKNINRLTSEKLLSNDRRVEKYITPPGFKPLTSRSITTCTDPPPIGPLLFHSCNRFYISNKLYFGERATEITQKWRTEARKSHLRRQRMF